ncbi:MAG: amrS, partial [Clostridiales bacterium]|nr:amrS [Clostridiales bacterium]
MFYSKLDNGFIACELCPHGCHITEGKVGICGTRKVSRGELKAINYGEVSSLAMDPIEKKPLYHYKPGSRILSVGSYGCNFRCGFCQNHQISIEKPMSEFVQPEELIGIGIKEKDKGNIGIAFTYNEPSIWYEYVYDVAKLAKE